MNVGIIGCGAAGMMAAISASYNGHKVTILEHGVKPGKKILATGNGRCNFTNDNISSDNYNEDGKELFLDVYSEFNNHETISFFEKIGILNICKNGYYYPRSEQASAIVESMMFEINRLGIAVIYECIISDIEKSSKFKVISDKGSFIFDKVIIAAGSKASPKTGSDGSGYDYAKAFGHRIIRPLPALCALTCEGFDFKSVSGVRCKSKVTLLVNSEENCSDTGELQLADYGVSGIPVFQISSKAIRAYENGNKVNIVIDFMPDETNIDILVNKIIERSKSGRYNRASDMFIGVLNDKLARAIVKHCNVKDEIDSVGVTYKTAFKLASTIKHCNVFVKGYKGFDNCQVCSGGIDCKEIKPTLESKICPGMYFAGEIIDVDGQCGGYNLQWAWSSGFVAGRLE